MTTPTDPPPPPPRPGIRVLRGVTFTIPEGGMVFGLGPDGFSAEIREVLLTASPWLDWIQIAIERFDEAKDARGRLTAAADNSDEENAALEDEFRACLQVATAAVFGLDGFYDVIKPHIRINPAELAARKKRRTARHIWVSDAIIRSARIPSNKSSLLRRNIKTSYRARDLAVHPVHEAQPPVLHRGLNQAVPSYIGTFSIETARGVMSSCIEALMWALDRPNAKSSEIVEIANGNSRRLHELVDKYITYPDDGLLRPWKTDE